jgi:hypothetical protein
LGCEVAVELLGFGLELLGGVAFELGELVRSNSVVLAGTP